MCHNHLMLHRYHQAHNYFHCDQRLRYHEDSHSNNYQYFFNFFCHKSLYLYDYYKCTCKKKYKT